MAPTSPRHFDYLVLGGGSGGVASSRRAARNGAKVMLVEGKALGGTCVNVGCVPKKVMWNASDLAAKIRMARGYDFDVPVDVKFNWPALKKKRDAYIERLHGIYERNLQKEGVEFVYGWAEFVDKDKTVRVKLNDGGEEYFTADHILVASGGQPKIPSEPKGADYGMTSDGFFDIEEQPKSVAIVGAGYIGVEFAGVFHSLGTETHMLIRGDKVLRKFDDIVSDNVTNTYIKHGINIHKDFKFTGEVTKLENGRLRLEIESDGQPTTLEVDQLIWTVGRSPLALEMGLDKIGIEINDRTGLVQVDEYQNTNVPGVYSLGDVAEEVALTPAAIAAGRKLAERLFGNQPDAKLSYENIPTAIFSHPEVGTVGLSEQAARKKFGDENIKVYRSKFINMLYSPLEQDQKESTEYKIVCEGPSEKVVGLHLFGDGSSEILQGFGVAIKMGATKADFDSCVAIHPTAAEELVTM